MNKSKFDYSRISKWHDMGYKGKGIKIATFEDTKKEHGKKVAKVIQAAAPEATLLSRPRPGFQRINNQLTPESKEKLTAFYKGLLDEGVSIVTFSVGKSGYFQALADLEKEILSDKVTFFASAGNDADEIEKTAPAYYHWFAVGACDLVKGKPKRAHYSNIDQKLDFMAFTGINNFGGTSCSAPLAASQWALVQSYALTQGRLFTPTECWDLIKSWCEDIGDPGFDPEGGYGLFRLPEETPPVIENPPEVEEGGDDMIVDVNLSFKNLSKRELTDTIVIHHAGANCSVEDVHRWHLQNGWSGIGYHYFIRKNGLIFKGRPEDTVGAHCAMHNLHTLGICCEGDFTKEIMTVKQFRSLCDLVIKVVEKYGASVKRHSDLVSTSCPGQNFPFGDLAISVVSKLHEIIKE